MGIEIFAQWIGYIMLILLALVVIVTLIAVVYICYDYWLKKLLGWKERELRADLFYFIKHKKEIREYIKNK